VVTAEGYTLVSPVGCSPTTCSARCGRRTGGIRCWWSVVRWVPVDSKRWRHSSRTGLWSPKAPAVSRGAWCPKLSTPQMNAEDVHLDVRASSRVDHDHRSQASW